MHLQKVISKKLCKFFFFFFLTSRRSLTKIAGSGSVSQRYRYADPDPYQNFMDPQHWKRQTFLLSQKPEGPALSERVPSLLGLKGAPPPPHSSYISGSQTQPSRSNTRQRGNIRTSRRAIVAPHRLWNHKKGIIQPWDSSIKCSSEVCRYWYLKYRLSITGFWTWDFSVFLL